jgi:oxalate decarboxylase
MSRLRISTTGMCEPHWHPETAEMVYIVDGYARVTILLPNGDQRLNMFKLKSDNVYFIPRVYPHHIENIGNEDLKILIFFDQSIAGHIGYKGSFSALTREVIGATQDKDVRQESARPGTFHWNTPETHWKMEAVFRPKLSRNFFR